MPAGNKHAFSIIVPAYNVEQYISECIESALRQSFQDFELILVDDGSTDHTGEICDRYQKNRAQHDKNQPHNSIVAQNTEKVNIKVIHQSNSGLSAARNTGIKAAQGEYLVFLDGDDYLEADALKVIHDNLEPGLDLLRFQAQVVFENGEVIHYPEAGFPAMPGVQAFSKIIHYHFVENAWLYAYRREFFLAHYFEYAEGCVAEDFGLTPLVIAGATRVKSIPNICYDYRERPGSITRGAASYLRRTIDIEKQLSQVIPELTKIPGSTPVLHYLVASFLTSATMLESDEFLQFYRTAKKAGWLKYLHPGSIKAIPRAFFLRHFPRTFYKIYRRQP